MLVIHREIGAPWPFCALSCAWRLVVARFVMNNNVNPANRCLHIQEIGCLDPAFECCLGCRKIFEPAQKITMNGMDLIAQASRHAPLR